MAGRPRAWTRLDVVDTIAIPPLWFLVLLQCDSLLFRSTTLLGALPSVLVAVVWGTALVLGASHSWSPRWRLSYGLFFLACGVGMAALLGLQALRVIS